MFSTAQSTNASKPKHKSNHLDLISNSLTKQMRNKGWEALEAFDWVHESQKASNTFISNINGKHFRFHLLLLELGNFYTQTDSVFHNSTAIFGSET